MRKHARMFVGGVAVALVAATACGGPPPSSTASTTTPAPGSTAAGASAGSAPGTTPGTSHSAGTAPTVGSATITSFDIRSSVTCHGPVDITLTATYETRGATSVAFLVDNTQVPGTPPTSGTFDVPLRCDGGGHTVILTALDAQDRPTLKSRAVATSTEPTGD